MSAHVLHNMQNILLQNHEQAMDVCNTNMHLQTLHLGCLARACFTNHHHHLVLSDDLQQLIPAVVHRQKAPLLLQGPALGPVTDSLQDQMRYVGTQRN